MKDQTEQVLAQLLERAVSGIDEAVAFSQAQIPDVVEQLLLWHGVKSGLLFAVGVAIILFAMTRLPSMVDVAIQKQMDKNRTTKENAKRARDNGEGWTRYGTTGAVTSIEYDKIMSLPTNIEGSGLIKYSPSLALVLVALPLLSNLTWLQILIAPKLYLLEYAAELVK